MKIARFYKNADPLMYESLARDAETRKVLGLAEIQANLDKSKRMFKQIDQDRRLSLEEGFKAKMGYYQKNPGFTMPQSERTKRPEMPVTEKLSDVERLFRKFRGEGGEDMPEEVVMEKPKTLWEKYKQSPYGVLFRGEKSSVTEAMPSQQMQSAPDMKLDPYWPKLSDDQKQKVLTLRQRNVSVDVIIDALRKEGTIK